MLQNVDTSNLAAERDFIIFKADVDKLNINKLVTIFFLVCDNLKTKLDDLDVDKLETDPVGF